MKRLPMIAATVLAATLTATALTACGSKDKPVADPSPSGGRSASPTSGSRSGSPHHAPAPSSSAKAAATTLDPCQLVTQSEASSLAHASFGPGKEEGTRIRHECVYGAQTPNVLSVIALQGASTGDAQTEWNQLLAEAKQGAGQAANMVTLTPDSTIADRAEWVELGLSQIDVNARGLAFLKGATGIYMIDLVRGGAAASRTALSQQAQTVLSRLP